MDTLTQILVLIGIPAAFILVMILVVLGPSWTRAGRYRPGEPWEFEPVMINGNLAGDIGRTLSIDSVGAIAELDTGGQQGSGSEEGGISARW